MILCLFGTVARLTRIPRIFVESCLVRVFKVDTEISRELRGEKNKCMLFMYLGFYTVSTANNDDLQHYIACGTELFHKMFDGFAHPYNQQKFIVLVLV